MGIKGLAISSERSSRSELNRIDSRRSRNTSPESSDRPQNVDAFVRERGESADAQVYSRQVGALPGRRRGQHRNDEGSEPSIEPVPNPPAEIPPVEPPPVGATSGEQAPATGSSSESQVASSSAASSSSSAKRPRQRIQLEIARDAGLLKQSPPAQSEPSENSSENSGVSKNSGGTTIQNQLMLSGAGYTSGTRDVAARASTSAGLSSEGSYQSLSQQLDQYFGEQALATMGTVEKK